jgi:phosphatidylinositol glycan class O
MIQHWFFLLRNISILRISLDMLDSFNILCFILYLVSVFSNSFIVFEDRMVYFMITTNALLMFYRAIRQLGINSVIIFFIYFVCIRFSSLTIRYRTHGTHHINEKLEESSLLYRYVMHILPAILPCVVLTLYDKDLSTKRIVWWYFPIQLSFIIAFWYSRDTALSGSNEEQDGHILWLPRAVYLTWLTAVILLLTKRKSDLTSRWYLHLFSITYLPLLMLKGLQYSITFSLMFIQTILGVYLMRELEVSMITAVFQWWLFGVQYFFALGLQNTVNTIQWTSGFVGIRQAHLIISGLLVGASILAPKVLYAMLLPFLMSESQKKLLQHTDRGILLYLMLHAATTFVDMIAVTIHRRHLMVWAIFAPKFIFDELSLIVLCVCILLLALHR